MPLILTPGRFTQRAEFYHQLAQLVSAGIGLVPALQLLLRNPPDASYREPIQRQLEKIQQGATFTDSLRATAGWLPELDIALIEAGERSGRLDDCFQKLSEYYHERARLLKQALSQLAYPLGLVHCAAFVFLVILPFAGSQFHASLPWLLVLAGLKLLPLYAGAGLIVYVLQGRHGERWQLLVEQGLHRVPLLGTARRQIALSRLALTLEALINAGVNIIQAWELAAQACGSPSLRRAILGWRAQVDAGMTPGEAVGRCGLFPDLFTHYYNSGEVSGKLTESLDRLSRHYREEGSRRLQAFAEWTPRLIYGIVAVAIGFKIVEFYTGYFSQIATMSAE